jgi:alpha-ketoglutarate-dependent taurine dioxygenase
MALTFEKLSPYVGVEVFGFTTENMNTPEIEEQLRDAFIKYHLLKINIADFSSEDQRRFAQIFGDITIRGTYQADPEEKDTQYVSNTREDGILGNGEIVFHHDHLYYKNPLTSLMLYAIEVPPSGSVTRFRSEAELLKRVPAELKDKAEKVECLHLYDYLNPVVLSGDFTGGPDLSTYSPESPRYWRPLTWKDPRSDSDILLLSKGVDYRGAIDSVAEGSRLIEDLYSFGNDEALNDEITYDHHWQSNDLIIWDNLVLAHARMPFNKSEPRTMRRTPIVNEAWVPQH